jgi:hypothetical protein
MPENLANLSAQEVESRQLLAELEAGMQRADVATATASNRWNAGLLEVADRRLWALTSRSLEDYCRARWKISRSTMYRRLDQARIATSMGDGEPIPSQRAVQKRKSVSPSLVPSWIYFVEHGTFIKIGVSTNVAQRLRAVPGRLIGVQSGDRRVERERCIAGSTRCDRTESGSGQKNHSWGTSLRCERCKRERTTGGTRRSDPPARRDHRRQCGGHGGGPTRIAGREALPRGERQLHGVPA